MSGFGIPSGLSTGPVTWENPLESRGHAVHRIRGVSVLRGSRLLVTVLAGAALALPTAVATAADYPPPSDVSGRVDPSRIHSGDCAVFSGEGFRPRATVAVTDNGDSRGETTSTPKGEFSIRLCYPVGSAPGRHELRGTGLARGSAKQPTQTVSAVLYVDAVPAVPGVNARTGSIVLRSSAAKTTVASGLALLLVAGAGTAVLTGRRGRRGRTSG